MSNRAIDAVKDFSTSKASERLLLVMIADGIGKDTGVYEARISTLMADCNMGERWVQKLINRLIELGELVVFERTGRSSAFAIPIFPGELGYDPQPCSREGHVCTGMHTPLSVDRENIRRDEWAAQRKRQRTSRRLKSDSAPDGGVNDSSPGEISPGGVNDSSPLPRTIVHPPVNDDSPPGELSFTHNPSLNPIVLPVNEPEALTHHKKKKGQKTPEPDTPSPLPPSPSAEAQDDGQDDGQDWEPGEIPASQLWAGVIERLKTSTPMAQIASWLAPARIARYGWDRDGVLRVELRTVGRAHADMLDQRYSYLISDAISRCFHISPSHVHVSYTHIPFNSPAPQVTRREVRA